MTLDDLQTVVVVGAGTLGLQLSAHAAMHDYDVVLYEEDEKTLHTGWRRLRTYVDTLVEAERIANGHAVCNRIVTTTDALRAGRKADVLCECLSAHPLAKANVLAAFDALAPAHAIFMMSTQTFVPPALAAHAGRPDKVLALRFRPPLWANGIVDIMPHAGTAKASVKVAFAFARALDQIPRIRMPSAVNDRPAYTPA